MTAKELSKWVLGIPLVILLFPIIIIYTCVILYMLKDFDKDPNW